MPSSGFVSTGHLPAAPDVGAAVQEAFARFSDARDGEPSTVYPALERVDPDAFGVSLIDVHGTAWEAGDVTTPFTIMSVAKPFVFALAARALGADRLDELVGVDATGLPFNSLEAVEAGPDGRTNPMVNAGAIATTALVPGATTDERWAAIRDGLSAFAGRPLTVDDEVYASASATNDRNRAIAWLLNSRGRLAGEPDDALDLYTRQSALSVTAHDLAVMGATLADGGVNPLTGERVMPAELCHHVLAVMLVAGLYETSGAWLYRVGLPAKSGIGGGIVTVSPGKGGLGTYAPRLDAQGNSVRGQKAARFLSFRLGLDLLASRPAP
ncbi:glutaminase A [Propioniciclava sp. MC1595]|uniref:glutaminase A n=1 Tax=unclassified Propioniciclava TaxID=2642922 RepID=UPI00160150D6|nr:MULTISPECIES: glutaminase A [unclassified Propioniciclava]MBB1493710.1 glutaminase A [Propioniciclava sp. MC1595]MBB1502889.1 glutaminase A [Propioniciclava sp. MC1683]QTE25084.1 glutaminase A [Propioniciclava sp. MC1595]